MHSAAKHAATAIAKNYEFSKFNRCSNNFRCSGICQLDRLAKNKGVFLEKFRLRLGLRLRGKIKGQIVQKLKNPSILDATRCFAIP